MTIFSYTSDELPAFLEALQRENERLLAQDTALQAELTTSRATCARLQEEQKTHNRSLGELEQKWITAEHEVETLSAQVATLTAQRDEFKRIGQGFERDYRNTFEQSCKNLQRAEALTAALRRYEWQPIETAPKDVSILAWMVFKNMAPSSDIATWHEYTEEFCGHSTRGGIPTHWMPLPEPPAVLRAASEGA